MRKLGGDLVLVGLYFDRCQFMACDDPLMTLVGSDEFLMQLGDQVPWLPAPRGPGAAGGAGVQCGMPRHLHLPQPEQEKLRMGASGHHRVLQMFQYSCEHRQDSRCALRLEDVLRGAARHPKVYYDTIRICMHSFQSINLHWKTCTSLFLPPSIALVCGGLRGLGSPTSNAGANGYPIPR